ncbi:uncharacterized protein HMPREF1541_09804 [Cyphellophora europaea CBS 101466]|uniref:Cobalamin-independent methionine synthase MetE C-terminal/archaeal domain-containing protein n=1 Tax=Cyphellophora europaea (strain CBS 101466) TaxID=1220924 RepID=W2SAL1_CYPE1|nr:uncharacterized protein HMPREF1541_09804 [Cyphellophora europaea CBS 101466]ETN44929.1 hypothetical protein HMPREF1541_09804 [Cyphellophora europaea CBS 101466]
MSAPNDVENGPVPVGVHMVGSVPLPSASDVFTTLSDALPGRLQRMPDGETGSRQQFVVFQREVFAAAPQVLRQYDSSFNSVNGPVPSQSELDAAVEAIQQSGTASTHYDTNAFESYKSFKSLQDAGKIPSTVKFQVSLPTPINVLCIVAEGYQAAVEPLYEELLLDALRNIQSTIPHESLSIQWDVAAEFAMLEGVFWPHFKPWFSPIREGIIERVSRLVDAVDPDVDVGLHLCYGDIGHRHFFEPADTAKLVDIANAVEARASRSLTYVHMPVPQQRTDAAYFAPLQDLKLASGSLFLGLVHYNDIEGTRQRIAAATGALKGSQYGVATECGMGRTPPEQLSSILEISAAVTGVYGN